MRDSRNYQALFCFMSDERKASWWNEQQAFRYLIKHQTQRKQTISQSFEREYREKTKQSKYINNAHQTMPKVNNAKRGKVEKKKTEWGVLIMAIPESPSEDPSTCFLLPPFPLSSFSLLAKTSPSFLRMSPVSIFLGKPLLALLFPASAAWPSNHQHGPCHLDLLHIPSLVAAFMPKGVPPLA